MHRSWKRPQGRRPTRRQWAAADVAVAGLAAGVSAVNASDHLDAPGLSSPGGNAQYDITDLYAFQSLDDAANVVLIMAVNPTAGVGGVPTDFSTETVYSFRTGVGTIGDPVTATSTLDFNFAFVDNSVGQHTYVTSTDHTRFFPTLHAVGPVGEPLSWGNATAQTGLYDDPFFFDLNEFLASGDEDAKRSYCDGQESDFFAGFNVSAIVLEVPSSMWSSQDISVWATTTVDGEQIDRVGRPAISTVFVPGEAKDIYNAADPSGDVDNFAGAVADFFGGTIPEGLEVLLPDVLTVNTGLGDGFLNGRHLVDDVIDIELGLITAGELGGDCVDANDVPFAGTFPYLAPAHDG